MVRTLNACRGHCFRDLQDQSSVGLKISYVIMPLIPVFVHCTGFSTTYFIQTLLQKKLPYSPKGNIIVSSIAAIYIGHKVTSNKSRICQDAWLAAEEKHTYFTENDPKH